ncbi:hypothetical protein [Curtobacterium sp. MCBD17_040]|uniref:hypothetical protein n=1 Tax=Curtobacterium sp. MCBD17_040 TaxID=2175674 RepID=UPI000DA8D737|nr:hypothetical protein [Curtobacterium sp. MCBD17_040]WIB65349.1 hypothetical protein DEI94_18250 [Curtobacterium sp. MCBD17_040]
MSNFNTDFTSVSRVPAAGTPITSKFEGGEDILFFPSGAIVKLQDANIDELKARLSRLARTMATTKDNVSRGLLATKLRKVQREIQILKQRMYDAYGVAQDESGDLYIIPDRYPAAVDLWRERTAADAQALATA